jgi:hypothetical protein
MGRIMRGPVRAGIFSRAFAVAFLVAGCTTTGNSGADYIDEHDQWCEKCSVMSPQQFEDALTRLRSTRDLRADIFVSGAPALAPVTPPLRTIESDDEKCAVASSEDVAKLVSLIAALKWTHSVLSTVRPDFEIRIYQAGRASERPVLEAFLDREEVYVASPVDSTILLNGRYVSVDHGHYHAFSDFVEDLTNQSGKCARPHKE